MIVVPSLRDAPPTPADFTRAGQVAGALIDAALKNRYIRAYIRDLTPWHKCPGLWTVAKVRANPIVKVEFEHASVIGCIGESLAAARGKCTFGEFIGVLPLAEDDPVGELNIVYVYKESSPYNRRVEQRRYMKKRLAKVGHRALVGEAMYHAKGKFIREHCPPEAVAAIAQRLKMTPAEFWRAARGKVWITIPKPTATPDMFGKVAEPEDTDPLPGE